MKPIITLALSALLLTPLASADPVANLEEGSGGTVVGLTGFAETSILGELGDDVEWHCDHDSPDSEQQHESYCWVRIKGFLYVIHTDPLHHGIVGTQEAQSSRTMGTSLVAVSGETDPYGVGCELDDDLDHSCWVWVGGQLFIVHFPRLDEILGP